MIRFGVVGPGNIARKFASDIQVVPGATITAVASRSLDRAKKFALEFEIPITYGSYEELAASKDIDAVYIATPHRYHKDNAILFMKHKKHVLCEKPIAVNSAELEAMIAVAQAEGVLLMEAMWTRFLPSTKALLEYIKTNQLGYPNQVTIPFGFDITSRANEDGRLLNPNLAGGSLLDIGVYNISFLTWIAPAPFQSLQTSALISSTEVDLMTTIDGVLDNKPQTKVDLECALDRFLSNTAVLEYDVLTIEVPEFWQSQSFKVNGEVFDYPHQRGGFEYQIQAFIDTIEAGGLENNLMTYNASRVVTTILDAIRRSIKLRYPFE